jgi:thiamine biosynthesis lipoprotein
VIGICWGALTWGVASAAAAGDTTPRRYEFTEIHMAAPVKLALYSDNEGAANRAAQAVYARFAELNRVLSDYDPESELSRLSHSSPHATAVPVSDPLWLLLERSYQLSEETAGAFDVTVGPLVRLWRRARRQGEFPSDERLNDARAAVGYQSMKLDPKRHTAQLLRPKMQLDLGGIAMGYAVDEGMAILKQHGITSAMIDASGDIGVSNPPPGKRGWRLGLVPLEMNGPPTKFLLLANAAVTTSGDAFQFVELAGKRYSHIVDPKTGLGMTDHSAVTVVAPDCMTADSLATAISALGPQAGLKLADKCADVAVYIVRGSHKPPEQFESSRWEKLTFDNPR